MNFKESVEIYRVGGSIRDMLLKLKSRDNDYVLINCSENEMFELGFTRVGKNFPVFLHPFSGEEYSLARTEQKVDSGYNGFNYSIENITLKDDLSRRDLTINAIAENSQGELIDPFLGIQDIENKVLRHIGESFEEDPVRILRLARFQATLKDFDIAPETIAMVKKVKESGELETLTKERVKIELQKVIKRGRLYKFFVSLDELGVLHNIFPFLKDYTIFRRVKRYIPFEDAMALLSINIEVDSLRESLVLSKFTCKYMELFLMVKPLLDNEISVYPMLRIIRNSRNIDNLIQVINLYNRVYRRKKSRVDKNFFINLAFKYREVGKLLSLLSDMPQDVKIISMKNIRYDIFSIEIEKFKLKRYFQNLKFSEDFAKNNFCRTNILLNI